MNSPLVRLLAVLATVLLMAACTAPATQSQAADGAPAPVSTQPATPAPGGGDTPRLGTPNPASNAVTIDQSCKTDADCTVKDVGNCCGYYPACVNVNSPTDPEGVKARCASEGRMGVCGFPAIDSCSCVNGQCAAAGAPSRRAVLIDSP